MRRIVVEVDEKMRKAIKKKLAAEDRSMRELVVCFFEEWLKPKTKDEQLTPRDEK